MTDDPKPKLVAPIRWAREDFKAKGMDRLGEDEADWIAEVILNRFRLKPMEGEDIGDAYEEPND